MSEIVIQTATEIGPVRAAERLTARQRRAANYLAGVRAKATTVAPAIIAAHRSTPITIRQATAR